MKKDKKVVKRSEMSKMKFVVKKVKKGGKV